jgi:hypothetical protein
LNPKSPKVSADRQKNHFLPIAFPVSRNLFLKDLKRANIQFKGKTMADPIQGKVDFIDANGEPKLHIDPDKADLFLGGAVKMGQSF